MYLPVIRKKAGRNFFPVLGPDSSDVSDLEDKFSYCSFPSVINLYTADFGVEFKSPVTITGT